MGNKRGFSGTCRVISVAGLIASLYIIIKLLHGQSDFVFPVILMACALVICPFNIAFTLKERTIGVIVAFNAVIFAAFVFITVISGCLNESFSYPYSIISVLLIVIFGATSAIKPPKLSMSIICFDGSVLMMVFICLYINVNHFAFSYTVFSIIGSIVGLLGLIAYRTSGAYGKREWAIIIVLFLIIALIAWLLFAFVVSPLSSGFELAGGTIAVAFTSLGALIDRFMKYLASLINTDDYSAGMADIAANTGSMSAATNEEGTTGGFQLAILAVIIAVVIIIAIILFVKYRKNRIKLKKQGGSNNAVKQNNTAFADAWNLLMNKIKRFIASKKFLKQNRNRAECVYFDLIRLARHTDFEKKEGDTATEFLLRLKDLLIAHERDVLCFDSLILAVNKNFYGNNQDKTEFLSAPALKANIRKSIHEHKSKQKKEQNT